MRPTPETAVVVDCSAMRAQRTTTDMLEGDRERQNLGETERVPFRPSKNAALGARREDIVELP